MSIEIRQLRCAAMAAEVMSFTRAAHKLGIKQSTLSKRVLDLERRLGITLFERSTRGAIPTKAAAEFLAKARRILDEIDGLQSTARAVRCGESGKLVFGLEHRKKAASTFSARLRREVGTQVKDLSEAVDLALRESLTRLASDIEQTFADLGRTDTGAVDEAALRDLQNRWENRIDESAAETKDRLERLRDQLVTVAEAVSRNESVTEITALIETRAEGYREQLDAYSELAQVGMSLGIVQHEFSSTTIAINDAIAKLQPWGTSNLALASLVRDVNRPGIVGGPNP
jgi:molybdenum-dependent DNA-binding transcriptional regulator ModE